MTDHAVRVFLDPLSAASWAAEQLSKSGGYASTSLVPTTSGGGSGGPTWGDVHDQAAIVSSIVAAIEPPQAAVTLQVLAAGASNEPRRAEQVIDLAAGRVARTAKGSTLDEAARRQFGITALLRVAHAARWPDRDRRPARAWYATSAGLSRRAIARAGWAEAIEAAEGTLAQWRDAGLRQLESDLDRLGLLAHDNEEEVA